MNEGYLKNQTNDSKKDMKNNQTSLKDNTNKEMIKARLKLNLSKVINSYQEQIP